MQRIFDGNFSLPLSTVRYLQVRWKYRARKPRHLGIAKSKIFNIHVPPILSVEERTEMDRLYNSYKTGMKSIRAYFGEQVKRSTESIQVEEDLDDGLEELIKINNEDNLKVAQQREARQKLEFEKKCEELLQLAERTKIQDSEERMKAEELVKETEMFVSKLIHKEDLDGLLDEILNNPPVSYNYAIDKEGSIITKEFIQPDDDVIKRIELAQPTRR